jgi:hypothetical protein
VHEQLDCLTMTTITSILREGEEQQQLQDDDDDDEEEEEGANFSPAEQNSLQ